MEDTARTSEMVLLKRHWLRHAVLLVLVDAHRSLSVAEIVEELGARGIGTARLPASRAVSDAMRADVVRGRGRPMRPYL